MHKYFVSYAHNGGFGRCEVTTPQPIASSADIAEVERIIVEGNGLPWVSVLNFQPFPEPTDTARSSR